MIDLYTWTTPNGRKVSIMLEECGLAYKTHAINIGKDEQFTPEFIAINPNSKIPALIDSDGDNGKPLSIFESGAILIYLAEKTGKFLAKSGAARSEALQWLMFQMGGVGPIFGQVHHFLRAAKEPVPYAIERYSKEKDRLYRERYPIDEDFIAALRIMPPACGVALGLDRLVMLAAGATHIEQVMWTPVAEL